MTEIIYMASFCVVIIFILLFDLLIVGRKSHVLSTKESILWTLMWVSFAIMFYFYLLFNGEKIHNITDIDNLRSVVEQYGPVGVSINENDLNSSIESYRSNIATTFITGYLIEQTLSIDNLFVIIFIFSAFSLSKKHYKKVLFWGILGAIVFRCIFIFAGVALVENFKWLLYVFGAFLVYSGIKIFFDSNENKNIKDSKIVKFLSNNLRMFPRYVKDYFIIRRNNKLYITPLLLVLIFVEFSDIVFAFDSIPAIFAISTDPYIIFFSNIFAIIGLRSMFFLLSKTVDMFCYLKYGVATLLFFIGTKLIFHSWLQEIGFKTVYSLYIILAIILSSIVLSFIFPIKYIAKEK